MFDYLHVWRELRLSHRQQVHGADVTDAEHATELKSLQSSEFEL